MQNENSDAKSTPKRMTLRDQQKATTRERLLDAAIEVFEEVGFRNTTIDQIASAAGAYRATFYLHFKDKTEVAAGLARRLTPSSTNAFRKLNAMKSPSLSTLEKWVAAYVEEARNNAVMTRMLGEALSGDEAFMDEYRGFLVYLADKVMEDAFLRVPAKRRALVRSKFILLCLTLDRYVNMNLGPAGLFPAANGHRAIAETWKSGFFDEQTVSDADTEA